MKNWLINAAAGYFGLSKIWDRVDGWKTRIAAAVGILSGVAGLIQEFLAIESKHDFFALLTFAKNMPQDPMWLLILGSLGVLGLGHKLDKVSSLNPATSGPPAPQAPPTPNQFKPQA